MGSEASALPGGYRLVRFGDIDSTSSEALRRARLGDAGRLWIVAGRQLAGRGRQGRTWVSETGNLYASVLVRPRCPPAMAATLSFAAALALREAVAALAPQIAPALRLKWPNDLLCSGAKLAGILLESEADDGGTAMAIGFGVNCAHHPAGTPYPVTDLAGQGAPAAPELLFDALNRSFARLYVEWADGTGFDAIRLQWLAHGAGVGGPITVNRPGGPLTGIFEDLDPGGALVLRGPGGTQRIAAGEVFLS